MEEERAPPVFITGTEVRITLIGAYPEPEQRFIRLAFHARSGNTGYPYNPVLHATAEQARTIADHLLQAAERLDPQATGPTPPGRH